MNDLISRQAAIRIISGYQDGSVDKSVAKRLLTQLPSADVMEVVRCKDCKYYEDVTPYGCCGAWDAKAVDPDDFCSDAERRTDAEIH